MVSCISISVPSPCSGGHCGCSVYDALRPDILCRSSCYFRQHESPQTVGSNGAADVFEARQQHLPSSSMLASFSGLPMLIISPSQRFPAFSIMRYNASIPSRISVKQRFCFPPSISLIGEPSTRLRMSCVIARELPIRAALRLSSRGPIQLNGRKRVNCKPSFRHRPRSLDQVIV